MRTVLGQNGLMEFGRDLIDIGIIMRSWGLISIIKSFEEKN